MARLPTMGPMGLSMTWLMGRSSLTGVMGVVGRRRTFFFNRRQVPFETSTFPNNAFHSLDFRVGFCFDGSGAGVSGVDSSGVDLFPSPGTDVDGMRVGDSAVNALVDPPRVNRFFSNLFKETVDSVDDSGVGDGGS